MKLIKRVTYILFTLIAFTSCEGDYEKTCPIVFGVPATAISGPTTAAVNEEITLSVSYKTAKKCGDFHRFYEVSDLNEKTITVNTIYDSCNCDEVYTIENEPYKFKETTAGVYILKFKKSNESSIVHTITVE